MRNYMGFFTRNSFAKKVFVPVFAGRVQISQKLRTESSYWTLVWLASTSPTGLIVYDPFFSFLSKVVCTENKESANQGAGAAQPQRMPASNYSTFQKTPFNCGQWKQGEAGAPIRTVGRKTS